MIRTLARVLNPLILRLAGTRLLPLYGVLVHRGRRSGKTYRTPVVVRPVQDGFVVPMPWGVGTDWYRNLQAAGGCVIRWKGRDYALAEPRVVAAASVRTAFGGFTALMMVRLGISQSVQLSFQKMGREDDADRRISRKMGRDDDSEPSTTASATA